MRVLQSGVEVAPQDIALPPDWSNDLDENLIQRLVASLEHGYVLKPAILGQGNLLVDGRHTVAACLRLGRSVRCDLYEFDDPEQAKITELATTLDRRELDSKRKAKLLDQRVELWRIRLERTQGSSNSQGDLRVSDAPKKRGPKPTAKGKAIAKVAAETGVTRQAVEQQLAKAKEPDPVESDPKVIASKAEVELLQKLSEPLLLLGDIAKQIGRVLDRAAKVTPSFDRMPGKFDQRHKDERLAAIGAVGAAIKHLEKAQTYAQDAEKTASRLRSWLDKQLFPEAKGTSAQELALITGAAAAVEDVKTSKGRHRQREQEKQAKRDADAAARREAKKQAAHTPPPAEEPPFDEFAAAADYDPTLCPRCDEQAVRDGACQACGVEVEQPVAPLGLSEPPKVGLRVPGGARKIRTVLVDGQGHETDYDQTLATADAAGVGGGPPSAE